MKNAAAIGYMKLAAKRVGLKEHLIRDLDRMMYELMDAITEEEAEEAYRKI